MAFIPLGVRLFLLIGLSWALPLLEHDGDADEKPPLYFKLLDEDDDTVATYAEKNPNEDDSGDDSVPTHTYFKLPLHDDEDTVVIDADNSLNPEYEEDGDDSVPTHKYFKLPLHDDEDTVVINADNSLRPESEEDGDDSVPTHEYFKLPLPDDEDTVVINADNSLRPESEEDSDDSVPTHEYFKLPLHDDEDTVVIEANNGVDPEGVTGEGEEEPDFQEYFRHVTDLVAKAPSKPNHESGKLLAKWSTDSGVNAEETGKYLEGDIINTKAGLARNGLASPAARWPDGIIPFEIDNTFSPHDLNTIENAFREYHKHTCIRFRRHTNEPDFIRVTKQNTGCWSSVGRIGGMQEVNLQTPGCLTKIGTPIHELMHAAGFMHEQNRWERDDYVTIYWQNIENGRNNNFDKAERGTTHGHGVEYDYGSVMHYSDRSFSKNNQPTIVPKRSGVVVGQRDGFSQGDIAKLRNMYGCGTHRQPSFLEALFG